MSHYLFSCGISCIGIRPYITLAWLSVTTHFDPHCFHLHKSRIKRNKVSYTYLFYKFIHHCIPNYRHTQKCQKTCAKAILSIKERFLPDNLTPYLLGILECNNYKYYNIQIKMEFRKKSVEWRTFSFFEFI